MPSPPPARILIDGAGIAGSTHAFFLARHPTFHITVVDRSPATQPAGQGIDIDGPALDVVIRMGILDEIRAKTTREVGAALVNELGEKCAVFDVGGVGLTRAIEIMRGDLAGVLFRAADASRNVEFRFQTSVKSLREVDGKVVVELQQKNDQETMVREEEFDIVVGADGVNSRTRHLAMGSPLQLKCLKPVGCFVAFLSIPAQPQDWPFARMCQFPGRRTLTIRPMGERAKYSSVYMARCKDSDTALLEAHAEGDREKAKAAFAELFQGLGWEASRVVEGMLATDNFYSDRLMQVKLERWSKGRVVLLGDAAYAPSPLTGKGTALAILGAFVLAQEMGRNRDDVAKAFEKYEKRLRGYVEKAQQIPLGGCAPYVLNLQTNWGIWLFRKVAGFVAWSGLVSWLPDWKADEFNLEG